MVTENEFMGFRKSLTDAPDQIVALERRYQSILVDSLLANVAQIKADFDRACDLRPFWINYAQRQRGRGAIGDSCPYSDLAEKTILPRLFDAFQQRIGHVEFAGIPAGSDLRFVTGDAFLHIDGKATGPRDNVDEIVVPPYQVSGDGSGWDNGGMTNSTEHAHGERRTMEFYPNLPPFYVVDGTVRLTVTLFVKIVYGLREFGDQPLDYLEAVCVPNGLLMFDGFGYGENGGLLIPGKDDQTTNPLTRRIRVRLDPLARIGRWRTVKIIPNGTGWTACERNPS